MKSLYDTKSTKDLANALFKVLSDSYVLALKTQNYHWNVEGEHFAALHALFGAQYEELSASIDETAERIRKMGHYPKASMESFLKSSSISEEKTNPRKWQDMIKILAGDQEKIILTIKEAIEKSSDDKATEDFLIGRLEAHEKNAWMLNSLLN